MIVVDFHTHFYKNFYSNNLKEILLNIKPLKHFKDVKAVFIILAYHGRDEDLDSIAEHYGLTVRRHLGLKYSKISLEIEFYFVQAEQIVDSFGAEFTQIAGNYFLTYTPLKYSFGIRKKIFSLWTGKNNLIFTPSSFPNSCFCGSDLLPYSSEVNYLASVGTIFDSFNLDDLLELTQLTPLGVYNFYNRRVFRILFSQRIFTRLLCRF